MIGDPTRARMLAVLMGGGFVAAGELAQAAGVTPQTASTHIAKLVESELVVARSQGRHRYFRLADADIAHALEALSLVAERNASADKWERGAYKPLTVTPAVDFSSIETVLVVTTPTAAAQADAAEGAAK